MTSRRLNGLMTIMVVHGAKVNTGQSWATSYEMALFKRTGGFLIGRIHKDIILNFEFPDFFLWQIIN